jgi:hypothetical protein
VKVLFHICDDELIQGYYGRLAAFNDRDSLKALIALLVRHLGWTDRLDHPLGMLLDAAANLNGLPIDDLVADYSCYAVLHPLGEAVRVAQDPRTALPVLGHSLARPQYSGWKACPSCVQADLADLRFSYWRRSHHVPGSFRCQAHGRPLVVVSELSWIGESPADAIPRGIVPSSSDYLRLCENKHINRAISFLEAILSQRRVLERTACQTAIRGRVALLGENSSAPRWFARFSAQMDEAFTIDWMQSTLFKANLRPGQMRHFAFSPFSGTSLISHTALAMVSAMLFPSSSDALHAFGGRDGTRASSP